MAKCRSQPGRYRLTSLGNTTHQRWYRLRSLGHICVPASTDLPNSPDPLRDMALIQIHATTMTLTKVVCAQAPIATAPLPALGRARSKMQGGANNGNFNCVYTMYDNSLGGPCAQVRQPYSTWQNNYQCTGLISTGGTVATSW